MSKNNYYKDGKDYRGHRADSNPIDETILEEARTTVTGPEEANTNTEEKAKVLDEPKATNNETLEPIPDPVIGVVTDCSKLNVRKEPKSDAEVICIVEALSEVMIDEKESTEEFYKVTTEAGAEGYCMKKYVTVKQ